MVRPSEFEIEHTREGPHLAVSVAGELDMRTSPMLTEHLSRALSDEVTMVTLDLGRLTFMDSTGVRLLIELNNRAQQERWQLRLRAPRHEAAMLVLRVTGTDTALPFEPAAEA